MLVAERIEAAQDGVDLGLADDDRGRGSAPVSGFARRAAP
jgi:hypothetical protein